MSSKIKWRKHPYKAALRGTNNKEEALELLRFIRDNDNIRREILIEYYNEKNIF